MDHRSYSYPDDLLTGRNILITGASDGIGRALAIHAAAHGARVIIHGRNVSKLEQVYDEIESLPDAPRPSIAVMDLAVADSGAYTSLADSLAEEFGHLDGLVNNAGMLGERYSIEQYDAAMWQQVMHVNVTAAFAITQVCLPLLHRSGDASVIFTSSGVGRVGRPFWGAYAVSKFATEGLSQVLASEQEHGSIRVNCINPGAVRTDMRRAAYPAEDRATVTAPEAIMPTYMYLLGPDSTGVNGQSLDAQ
jgi:NAD(P)-dependent dehydrogenase (short-subunit alcohol dehydrogenase family)